MTDDQGARRDPDIGIPGRRRHTPYRPAERARSRRQRVLGYLTFDAGIIAATAALLILAGLTAHAVIAAIMFGWNLLG